MTFFAASIRCMVGNGKSSFFWADPWLDDQCIMTLMPNLVEVGVRARRGHTVAAALEDHAWIQDITGPLTIPMLVQYIHLHHRIYDFIPDPDLEDQLTWRWCTSG
jgi:hypothetical protein